VTAYNAPSDLAAGFKGVALRREKEDWGRKHEREGCTAGGKGRNG